MLGLTTAAVDSGCSSRGVFAIRAKLGQGAGVEDLAASGRSFPAVVSILTLLHTGTGRAEKLSNSLMVAATYQRELMNRS